MFGTDSIFKYVPVENLNRLIIPVMVFYAISAALSISLIKNRRTRNTLFIIILLLNLLVTLYYVNALSPAYSMFQNEYNAVNSFGQQAAGINTTGYVFYYNYSSVPDAACFEFRIAPADCRQLLNPQVVNFSKSDEIFLLGSPLPNETPYYHNSTYGYYIYVNR